MESQSLSEVVYIRLSSFDVSQNRYRIYGLAIRYAENDQDPIFIVYISWGRMILSKNQQVNSFATKAAMLRFIQEVLQKRYRNGYKILEMSADFPEVKALERLEYSDRVGEQLRLF